jgi:hypothetical protein
LSVTQTEEHVMFVRMSRIALDGGYRSPNVCFIGPDEEDPDVKDDKALEGDDPDAGADQPEDVVDADSGDEGDDSDEATDAAETEPGAEEGGPQGAPVPVKRTASDVIRAEKKARKENEARAAEATRKADEALRRAEAAERRAEEAERNAQARRQQETREAEAARVELMSESEKIAYYRQQDRQEFEGRVAGLQFQQWDSTDRMEFRQLKREDPLVARVADKVEVEFERLRAQGRPVAREILANQEIAKMVREERSKAGSRQRDRAAAGVRRETVKPRQARSDVATPRQKRSAGDDKAARRARLEDVEL